MPFLASCRGRKGCPNIFVTLQEMKTRNEEMARKIELLEHKLEELDQLARARGLAGVLNFRHTHTSEDKKSKSN